MKHEILALWAEVIIPLTMRTIGSDVAVGHMEISRWKDLLG